MREGYEEEKRCLKLKIAQADLKDKPALAEELRELVGHKVRMNEMSRRMEKAAEVAEKYGTGAGGRGSKED